MISLEVAKKLKEAGLTWKPAIHDFFSVPFADLEHRIFVLSDMTINQEILQGWPALTFSGAMEWAMDYILTMDVVWMPTESQLREQIMVAGELGKLILTCVDSDYEVSYEKDGVRHIFADSCAEDAYGKALLNLL